MIVLRQTGGLALQVRYSDKQFEFQLLNALTVREDLAAAAGESVVCDGEFGGQAQHPCKCTAAFDPPRTKSLNIFWRADPHVLAHSEHSYARWGPEKVREEAVRQQVQS
ncbi:hypothetical protein QFZ96_002502 [Paraburkholderia youngii]